MVARVGCLEEYGWRRQNCPRAGSGKGTNERENSWTKRIAYTLTAVGVHRRVPILGHGNNLRDCLRVGIAGWVELRADVEGSDAIEGGRVILSAGRHGGEARDGSDRRSKQETPHHLRHDDKKSAKGIWFYGCRIVTEQKSTVTGPAADRREGTSHRI